MKRMTPKIAKEAIGITDGKLSPCPPLKNCVCSHHKDKFHIAPIDYHGDDALNKIKEIIAEELAFEIQVDEKSYLHITHTSDKMKFKDDIEFFWEPDKKVIHVRSASRLGYWDLGVNRKRVERIRKALKG